VKEYAFCESAWAGSRTPWHIRRLTDAGRKPGGGADTKALCGREVAWDLKADVDLSCDRCCRKCAEAYAAAVGWAVIDKLWPAPKRRAKP